MIVFLVGGESRLMDALITKMEKDGHKTYLLTGKRDGRGKYRRVFERYNFPYDSESVREIFTNVNPDLVIFLGAYDTNYDWSDARRESVRYTADLTAAISTKRNRHRPKAFRQWRFCREKISAKAIVTPERWTRGFCASIICMIFHGKERPTITHVSR